MNAKKWVLTFLLLALVLVLILPLTYWTNRRK